jgi:predicted metal-dependent phosphoesterase TrpH
MIDLHMHTTASDGRSTPEELVAEVASKGIRIMAVTDHDTIAGVAACQTAARDAGVTCHVGIEITSVDQGRDVHMLGYGVDPAHVELGDFLTRQRLDRRRRLEEIGTRLAQLGVPIDLERAMVDAGRQAGRAMGRPMAAAALIAAGHVADIREAFDRYLGDGKPAFVERIGPSPADVAALIGRAGGVASLAHPGKSQRDHLIAGLADAGLPAIEVYHPDHDPIDTARYKQMARSLKLLMTGGSDYHGVGSTRELAFGRVHLPSADYARLAERLGWTVIHAH